MTDAGGELYRAVNSLRKAAEAALTGNNYYQAANRIADLIELIGPAGESTAPTEEAARGFPAALARARTGVESHLSGNRYYMAINKLDELGSFLPISPPPAQRRPSFDELAAASKARTGEAAASLGIITARTASSPEQFAGALAGGELERRSSEPCLMAELAPPALEPVAAAAIFTEAAAPAHRWEAAQNLGSPAVSDASLEEDAVRLDVPAAEAARDAPPPASTQTIQVKKPDEIKPREPKTLFKLWLDLTFGRKD
jgi:hypothetical protein